MLALFGIASLVIVVITRPQDAIGMPGVSLVAVAVAIAVGGCAIELRRGWRAASTLPWIGALVAWIALSDALHAPDQLRDLAILAALYGTTAHAIRDAHAYRVVASVVVAACLSVTAVCLHESLVHRECVVGVATAEGEVDGAPDGRRCALTEECQRADDPREVRCEHIGWLGLYTVGDRVRYLGDLHDPNEVALALVVGGLALVIGFATWRSRPQQLALGATALVVLFVVHKTLSRGGLVAALLVLAVCASRRFGWRVLVAIAAAAIPIAALGLRHDEAATSSTVLRYRAWDAGLAMWRDHPIAGVGAHQFTAHHPITAHNTFVLALSELGVVGLFLLIAALYASAKLLVVADRALAAERSDEAAELRGHGTALLAALAGIVFQITTLSFLYHPLLWLFLGLVAGWAGAVRAHLPDLQVRLGARDLPIIAALTTVTVVLLQLFLRLVT